MSDNGSIAAYERVGYAAKQEAERNRINVFSVTDGACINRPGVCAETQCRFNLVELRAGRSYRPTEIDETCVLRKSFCRPHTLEQIGKVLGCTRERSRQLEMRALDKVASRLGAILGRRLADPVYLLSALADEIRAG